MDYETKGPMKSFGVSLYPVYYAVYVLGTLAITIIGKYFITRNPFFTFRHSEFQQFTSHLFI